jgi:hypothetical protein
MKELRWDPAKNIELKDARRISFEAIEEILATDGPVEDLPHPNNKKYPKQRIFFVRWQDYVYAVPYVEEKEYLFLKTVYPSRAATKRFLK